MICNSIWRFFLLLCLFLTLFSVLGSSLTNPSLAVARGSPLIKPLQVNEGWTITNSVVLEDEIVTLTGNLTILEGGSLTLRNASLLMNSSYSGEFEIYVGHRANLTLEANAAITATISQWGWGLRSHEGSLLCFHNSTLRYARDVHISTKGAQISNCTFLQSFKGIALFQAHNSVLFNNKFQECSYGISVCHTDNCTISSNSLAGGTTGIYLGYSSGFITGNSISECETGVKLWGSASVLLNSNNITNIEGDGIRMVACTDCWIFRNRLSLNSQDGIGLGLDSPDWDFSSNCTVFSNILLRNGRYGIYLPLHTYSFLLYDNIFAFNAINGQDDSRDLNWWDNGTYGNWWSDYAGIDSNVDGIGDAPYYIAGDSMALDRFPLIEPEAPDCYPPRITNPEDLIVEVGTTGRSIAWQPSDRHPANYLLYRNEVVIDSGAWASGTISTTLTDLGIGHYNFTLIVFDKAGNFACDTVWVTVVAPSTTSKRSEGFAGLLLVSAAIVFLKIRQFHGKKESIELTMW